MPVTKRLRGPLDVKALGRSLNEIVRRHEVLRTTFVAPGGEPRQVVAPSLVVPLRVVDFRDAPQPDRELKVRLLAGAEIGRPFDLATGPLVRARLFQLEEEEFVFLLVMHHIVSDGWSTEVLLRELSALYEAFRAGQASPLPELALQYGDFAIWQRAWLEAGGGSSQLQVLAATTG